MCTEFIFDPQCEELEKCSCGRKKEKSVSSRYATSNTSFYGLPPVIRSTACNKWCDLPQPLTPNNFWQGSTAEFATEYAFIIYLRAPTWITVLSLLRKDGELA